MVLLSLEDVGLPLFDVPSVVAIALAAAFALIWLIAALVGVRSGPRRARRARRDGRVAVRTSDDASSAESEREVRPLAAGAARDATATEPRASTPSAVPLAESEAARQRRERAAKRSLTALAWTATATAVLAALLAVMFDQIHVALGCVLAVGVWISAVVCCVPVPPLAADVESDRVREKAAARSSMGSCRSLRTFCSLRRKHIKLLVTRRRTLFVLLIVVLSAVTIGLMVGLYGTCLDLETGAITVRFQRYSITACAAGPPCHVYSTVANTSLSTSVIVNFHAHDAWSDAAVVYDTAPQSSVGAYAFSAPASSFRLSAIDEPRSIYWAELTGLAPGTTYYLRAGGGGNYSVEFTLRTLPATGAVRAVVAGDMDVHSMAKTMSALAGSYSPDLVVAGGDIAYASGWCSCYLKWDEWLSNYQDLLVGASRRLVPIIISIGNHEVSRFFYGDALTQSPFFSRFFPQTLGLNGTNPLLRPTFHSHVLRSDIFFVVLDTDHLTLIEGAQTAWLESALSSPEAASARYRFAVYHVPLYPSVRAFSDTHSTNGRTYFGPVFDRYNLTIGFENHDHAYKRTKKLFNGQASTDGRGTVYMGDGAWGVDPRTPDMTRSYLATASKTNYFALIDIDATGITMRAINKNNVTFDSTFLSA